MAQIPWASAGAARSQMRRKETSGAPEITKEERLLAALLSANQELVDVFKCYGESEAAAIAEKEKGGYNRDHGEQKADTTVRAFGYGVCSYPFGISLANPVYLP